MDFDAYERKIWAGRAAAYQRGFARLTAHTAGALLDAAGTGAGTRLLDVGTGPGVVAGAAVARGARVTAVDAEPSMAEAAARNVPGLDVRVAVLPDLPLNDGEFDAVTGNFVINAVGDPAVVLAEPANLRGVNPIADFEAIVSCQSITGGMATVTNVATGPFPASMRGNADIRARVKLPEPCIAPIVFVASGVAPTGAWFAATGS